jgi:hypothetical protein
MLFVLFTFIGLFFFMPQQTKKHLDINKIRQQIDFMPTQRDEIIHIYVEQGINVKTGMQMFCPIKNCLINQNSNVTIIKTVYY